MSLVKCPNCEKEFDSSASFCPYCGFKLKSGKVTILGYTEKFAVNPPVSIFKDGVQLCAVERNGKIELDIEQDCMLQFKCSSRSTQCVVKPNDWVLLSMNRLTGGLNATITDENNCQTTISQIKKKSTIRLILSIIIIIVSFIWMIGTLKFFDII